MMPAGSIPLKVSRPRVSSAGDRQYGQVDSARASSRPPCRTTLMSGMVLGYPASRGPTSDASGTYPVGRPPHSTRAACSSARKASVCTNRLAYRDS
jgi:hypothetical protein